MLTKERVFEIMGNYYGNEFYRHAIRLNSTEHDLYLITEFLNKVNDLGYSFSGAHKLVITEDIRFVPIILNYYKKFNGQNFRSALLLSIRFRSYSRYIPQLLSIYEHTTLRQDKIDVSQCLLLMRCKEYIPQYLKIVNQPEYDSPDDLMMNLLCKLRVKEAIPRLLELLKNDPRWTWTFLWGAPFFREPSLIPYIEPFINSEDGEYRTMARKAIEKLNKYL